MTDGKPTPKFEVDDPVWIEWSSGPKQGWITEVHHVEYPTKPGNYFVMYGILQKDGKGPEFGRVAERLIARREL